MNEKYYFPIEEIKIKLTKKEVQTLQKNFLKDYGESMDRVKRLLQIGITSKNKEWLDHVAEEVTGLMNRRFVEGYNLGYKNGLNRK